MLRQVLRLRFTAGGSCPHRLLWMGVQTLEGRLLPGRAAEDPRPRGGRESKEEISCTPWRRRVGRGRGGRMQPTLVTGANGHVGNNLCRLLLARGERVRAMVRATEICAATSA